MRKTNSENIKKEWDELKDMQDDVYWSNMEDEWEWVDDYKWHTPPDSPRKLKWKRRFRKWAELAEAVIWVIRNRKKW